MKAKKIKLKKEDMPKVRNQQLHNALIQCGHHVVEDKRKKSRKYACRNGFKSY